MTAPTQAETSVERFDVALAQDRRPVRFELWNRRSGIGASEWTALVGASPWSTPAQVWLEKSGLGSSRETDVMRAGRDLETTVLRMAARQLDRRLVHNAMTFRHPDWPRVPLYATPDGFTRDGTPRDLVEIKVVGHRMDEWKAGPPLYVDWQVQAQLAVLPQIRSGIVVALIGGDVKTWRVDRDPDVQAEMPETVAAWWRDHVVADRAPDPVSDNDRWLLLRARVAQDVRQERVATPDEQRDGTALRALLTQRADLDHSIDLVRLQLADAAQDSDVLGLGWKASWSSRATVDWRALVRDLGITQTAIDRHTTRSPAFTFRQGKEPPE